MARKGSTKTTAHLMMDLRTPTRPELQDTILAALRQFGELSVPDLTEGLGYSAVTTVGSQMSCLYEEGLVKRRKLQGLSGWPRWVYSLTESHTEGEPMGTKQNQQMSAKNADNHTQRQNQKAKDQPVKVESKRTDR